MIYYPWIIAINYIIIFRPFATDSIILCTLCTPFPTAITYNSEQHSNVGIGIWKYQNIPNKYIAPQYQKKGKVRLHMVKSSRLIAFLRSLLAYLFLSSLPPTGSLCEQLCTNCSALHWGMLNMNRMCFFCFFFLKTEEDTSLDHIWTELKHLCLHHMICMC